MERLLRSGQSFPKKPNTKQPIQSHDKINAVVVGAHERGAHTFLKELVPQDRVRGHLSPYPNNPAGNLLIVRIVVIHRIHAVVYARKISMDLLQPPARGEICVYIPLIRQRRSNSQYTWELQVLAKRVDDNVPPFLMIDVDGEGGDGIVRQRHERLLNRFLWLWLLSPRARTGHVREHEEDKVVEVRDGVIFRP